MRRDNDATERAVTSSATVHGVGLHAGEAAGPLLRLDTPLSLWGGTAPDGTIVDPHHPQQGRRLTDAIVIMTSGRGSSSSASVLAEMIRTGAAPAAFVLAVADGILVLGALVAAELYDHLLPIVLVDPDAHAALPHTGDARVVAAADGRARVEVSA